MNDVVAKFIVALQFTKLNKDRAIVKLDLNFKVNTEFNIIDDTFPHQFHK